MGPPGSPTQSLPASHLLPLHLLPRHTLRVSSNRRQGHHQVGSGLAFICKTERKTSSPCTFPSPPPPRGWVVSAQIRQAIQGCLEEGWLTYWAPGRSLEISSRQWSSLRSIIRVDIV